jgi:hypothetical protein
MVTADIDLHCTKFVLIHELREAVRWESRGVPVGGGPPAPSGAPTGQAHGVPGL